jgi:hypothetical protein
MATCAHGEWYVGNGNMVCGRGCECRASDIIAELEATLARFAPVIGLAHRFVCALGGAKLRKSDFDAIDPLILALGNLPMQDVGRCLDACAPVSAQRPDAPGKE